ncbi:MAG TPA: PaaI family thioesterase [Candidatus Thermoplasmatota archaeon]|nr:PaaI family thioesterase [Candidatus Thermoplasmatota archaeon]
MTERTRTFSWADPNATAQHVGKASGLEIARMIIEKRTPTAPIARLMDFELVDAAAGFAAFECQPQEFHYNPIGVVHGGLAMTLLDSAMGSAVQTTLDATQGYTTLDVNVHLTRMITKETPRLRAEGRVVHSGRTMRTAAGELRDAGGRLYAHGTTTCLVMQA